MNKSTMAPGFKHYAQESGGRMELSRKVNSAIACAAGGALFGSALAASAGGWVGAIVGGSVAILLSTSLFPQASKK